jgi:hypothetical protein
MAKFTCIGCGVTIETDDPDETTMSLWPFVCGTECLVMLQEREKEHGCSGNLWWEGDESPLDNE